MSKAPEAALTAPPAPIERPARPPGRARRAVAFVASAVALSATFAASLVAAVALHLDLPPARRVARIATNQLLASLFEGKIVVDQIEHLGIEGVHVTGAVALDPTGAPVIRVSSLRARFDLIGLARMALAGEGDLTIAVPEIRIHHADVLLDLGPSGDPRIAAAFTTKETLTITKTTEPSAPSRVVRVSLPRITIERAFVSGAIAPPRSIDADVSGLVGSVAVGPEGVAVDVERTAVLDRSFLPAKTQGTANYHLRADEETTRMWTSFAGQVGSVQVLARVELDGDRLVGSVEVPKASAEEIASLLPGIATREPLRARGTIEGEIPTFDVTAAVGLFGETDDFAEAEGRLDATGPLRVALDVQTSALDPSLFGSGLPKAALTASGHATLTLEDELAIAVDAHTSPLFLEGELIPETDVHLALVNGVLSGSAHLYEIGIPTDATFLVTADDGVHFEAEGAASAIRDAPRIAGTVDGSATVHVAGKVTGERVEARVDGSFENFSAPGDTRMRRGRVKGHIDGLVSDLQLDATLDASGLHAGGYDFADVVASAHGPVLSPRLNVKLTDEATGAAVDASGQLDGKTGMIGRIAATVKRDGVTLEGTIASVSPSSGGVRIEGIALRGERLGDVSGTLRVEGDDIRGKLRGDGVDLGEAAKLLGFPLRVRGLANIDIDLDRSARGRKGHIKLELENGELTFVKGLSAQLTATFEDDAMTADALVRLVGASGGACDGTIASLQVIGGKGKLVGPLLRASTWLNATGTTQLAAEEWQLGCLAELFPIGLPTSEIGGTATARARLERSEGERFPSLRNVLFRTKGAVIAGPIDIHEDVPEWESRDIDLRVTGGLDGTTGHTWATLEVLDLGRLAELSVASDLDLATLLDRPKARTASLRGSAVTATLSIPKRSCEDFGSLPAFVRATLPPITGNIGLDAYVQGTFGQPFLVVRASGGELAVSNAFGGDDPLGWSLPIDIDALITYDSTRATLTSRLSRGQRDIASASGELLVAYDDLLTPKKDAPIPWKGSVSAKLMGLQLGQIPALAEADVRATLDGTIEVKGLNERPTLDVELTFPDLSVGTDLAFDKGAVSLHIRRREEDGPADDAIAIAKAELVATDGGRLDVQGYAAVTWQLGLFPTIDFSKPADLYALAHAFRLAALYPLVSGDLSRLDGKLEGPLRLGWSRLSAGEEANISADLQLTEGVVHVPQIGQELSNAEVHILSDPKTGLVRFDDISAKALSGSVHGWGLARLDGLLLRDAAAELTIDPGQELPIMFEGVPLGSARGTIGVTAEKHGREIAMKVEARNLHIDLPASSGRNVQSLDEHPDVTLSHPLGPPKEPRSKDALRYAITLDLQGTEIAGTDLDLTLVSSTDAPPRVDLSDQAVVSGVIEIQGGSVAVFGKLFEIDHGIVRLRQEDAGNPHLNVTAHWDAPSGYRVFVDYAGILKPVTNDKIRLRSSPPLANNEILALVLFGREPDAASADQGQSDAGGAVGLASAELVNQLIGGIAPLRGLSTRFGTAEGGGLKTSVAYDLGDTLTARASFEGASTATGQEATQAATASGQKTEVSVDWRFTRNWLLRATLGLGETTQGQTQSETKSGLDLLWQYRY